MYRCLALHEAVRRISRPALTPTALEAGHSARPSSLHLARSRRLSWCSTERSRISNPTSSWRGAAGAFWGLGFLTTFSAMEAPAANHRPGLSRCPSARHLGPRVRRKVGRGAAEDPRRCAPRYRGRDEPCRGGCHLFRNALFPSIENASPRRSSRVPHLPAAATDPRTNRGFLPGPRLMPLLLVSRDAGLPRRRIRHDRGAVRRATEEIEADTAPTTRHQDQQPRPETWRPVNLGKW